jgi:hypothetical protein
MRHAGPPARTFDFFWKQVKLFLGLRLLLLLRLCESQRLCFSPWAELFRQGLYLQELSRDILIASFYIVVFCYAKKTLRLEQ